MAEGTYGCHCPDGFTVTAGVCIHLYCLAYATVQPFIEARRSFSSRFAIVENWFLRWLQSGGRWQCNEVGGGGPTENPTRMPDWAKVLCAVCVIVSLASVCFAAWLRRSVKAHFTHGGAGLRDSLAGGGGSTVAQW